MDGQGVAEVGKAHGLNDRTFTRFVVPFGDVFILTGQTEVIFAYAVVTGGHTLRASVIRA